ncbi:MAG: DUF362 domain-containing protein [Gammaproteobacteria bacterium]|nr:DUF362 domain-containing protein [Gammaproteobacteria bacterium]
MRRRTFLRATVEAGLLAAAGSAFGRSALATGAAAPSLPDLVAVRGATPERLFDAGIAALGGMKSFVRPGQTVVVKPNIAWDVPPERAGNTNPQLVRRVVEHCREAGAKAVYVFDYTCDHWQRTYRNSGIEQAVRDAGGTMAPGNSEGYFQAVRVNGRSLQDAKEHELILEADVFINVPVLKNHGSATVTCAMKNLMGIIWDRQFWHRSDLHQCIADFAAYRRPTLNVVDAYNVMVRNGPRGVSTQDVVRMESLLISTDMVAADTAAAKLMSVAPESVRYIPLAATLGVGRSDLEGLRIERIKLG